MVEPSEALQKSKRHSSDLSLRQNGISIFPAMEEVFKIEWRMQEL
jgi:hypothetical protein